MSNRKEKIRQMVRDIMRNVTIPFDNGFTITVTYRLGALTDTLTTWKAKGHSADRSMVPAWIERVITHWDLADDDGKPIPVTVAAMQRYEVPVALLVMIQHAIEADATPENLDPFMDRIAAQLLDPLWTKKPTA